MPAPTSATITAVTLVPGQTSDRAGLQDTLVTYALDTGQVYAIRILNDQLDPLAVKQAVKAHAKAVAALLGTPISLS
jgi:hypothetical protein